MRRSITMRAAAGLLLAAAFAAGWLCGAANTGVCDARDLNASPALCSLEAVAAATGKAEEEPRRVCLTFDDGPSKNTPRVLDILREEQVHATFFVVAAQNNQPWLPLVQREVLEGHQVALHSCSHEYREIYRSADAFWQDIDQLKRALSPYVDAGSLTYLRFPGGSSNTVSRRYGGDGIMAGLKREAEQRGLHWVDWNLCAEDAAGGDPSPAQIVRNVTRDVGSRTACIVLMHDTAATGNTVEALPELIAWFRERDFVFCTVRELYEGEEKA